MDYFLCFLCLMVIAIFQSCSTDDNCTQPLQTLPHSLFQFLFTTASFSFSKKDTGSKTRATWPWQISNLNCCSEAALVPKWFQGLPLYFWTVGGSQTRKNQIEKTRDEFQRYRGWKDHEGKRWNPRKSAKAHGAEH